MRIAGLLMIFLAFPFAVATSGTNPTVCTDFEDGTVQGWTESYVTLSVKSPGCCPSSYYLQALDNTAAHASRFLAPSTFYGDWTDWYALCFGCEAVIEYDYNVFEDGWPDSTAEVRCGITLQTDPGEGAGIRATFKTSFIITEGSGWHHIVAPVTCIENPDDPLPSNSYGYWVMCSPWTNASWNELLENVNCIYMGTDIAGYSGAREKIGVDNFCLKVSDTAPSTPCSKEGDPGFYTGFGESVREVTAGEIVCWELATANYAFVSTLCTGADTFCLHVYDTEEWLIASDPLLGTCSVIEPEDYVLHDVCITVPCEVDTSVYDTVIAVFSYCDFTPCFGMGCRPDCGDCEDPNWHLGSPHYSADTVVLHVVQTPPSLEILQEEIYTICETTNLNAYIPFSICNSDSCSGPADFGYCITSRGHIGPTIYQCDTVCGVSGGECEDVYGVLDPHLSIVCDYDTLRIIAWSLAAPVASDTCVQVVHVVECPCTKDGDPALYIGFSEDYREAVKGEQVCYTLGPANFGFVSGTCTGMDTFCVHVYDTEGWPIDGEPSIGSCTILEPLYYWLQDVCISVPIEAEVCDIDTVIAVMTYCCAYGESLSCDPSMGDCEDPNWYSGNPYYSADTVVIHVVERPPTIDILQDSLFQIWQGWADAYIPFQVCNPDTGSLPRDYGYCITSRGHIGPALNLCDTVPGVPGGGCEHVYGILDGSMAVVCDQDTLTIIAWSVDEPVVYDTCVQFVHVVEEVPVPLFTKSAMAVLVLGLVALAAVFMKRRRAHAVFLVIGLIALSAGFSSAQERSTDGKELKEAWSLEEFKGNEIPESALYLRAPTTLTYVIVFYDFEQMDWQGWTRIDNTAQIDEFWHVDNFAGLAGHLLPLQGSQSVWCGARPGSDEYMCPWQFPPGYGSNWNQHLTTDRICFCGGKLMLSYRGYFDSNPPDRTCIEYDAGFNQWVEIARFEDQIDTTTVHEIVPPYPCTKLRFHFMSDGKFDDRTGDYTKDTDGGAIVDSIVITDDCGVLDYTDFEPPVPVGAKDAGIWHAGVQSPFGTYSKLVAGLSHDKDPYPGSDNYSTQVVFWDDNDHSAEYPGYGNTPAGVPISYPCCDEPRYIYQDEMIVSPVIDLTRYSPDEDEQQLLDIPAGDLPYLKAILLQFDVYCDNPISNLVGYYWKVRKINDGCPGPWVNYGWCPVFKSGPIYFSEGLPISGLVGNDLIQLAFGVVDACPVYGSPPCWEEHTPAPWFDNVKIRRYQPIPWGCPQWVYRSIDLFQDNFPEQDDLESYVRADMASDINSRNNPLIRPGDSVVVLCTSPTGGGIAEDGGGARVYMHVRCTYVGHPGDPKPGLFGPSLEGTYGHYSSDDGVWTVIQGDTAVNSDGIQTPDWYMFDLNDSLFTRGYRIDYYFKAYDNNGDNSTLPDSANVGAFFEFTCLPTIVTDVLYVDDFHGRGTRDGAVQLHFDEAFDAVLPDSVQPDRFDVNGPSSMVSNGLGSRARLSHLLGAYSLIIWDSGDLEYGTIADGSHFDKSQDCQILIDWLDQSPHPVGLWVLGDHVASDLKGRGTSTALTLLGMCGVDPASGSYFDLTGGLDAGGIVNPKVTGINTGPFYHDGRPDTFIAFGSIPPINSFDVLEPAGEGLPACAYPEWMTDDFYAGVYTDQLNGAGQAMRTIWFGCSYLYIMDAELGAPIVRNEILKDAYQFLIGGTTNADITGDETPRAAVYQLHQNFPNPFNPSTTIKFEMKTRGPVRIRVYNVAGQLVKTLVDEVRDIGPHTVTWNGRNEHGSRVASGVYFCCMQTRDFFKSKKLILLR